MKFAFYVKPAKYADKQVYQELTPFDVVEWRQYEPFPWRKINRLWGVEQKEDKSSTICFILLDEVDDNLIRISNNVMLAKLTKLRDHYEPKSIVGVYYFITKLTELEQYRKKVENEQLGEPGNRSRYKDGYREPQAPQEKKPIP